MNKYTFTAEQLEAALTEIEGLNEKFPELPIKFHWEDSYDFWSEDTFPLTIKKIGENQDVTVRVEEYFAGEEGGDHNMRCVLSVGWGDQKRFFLKTGLYDSWDSSEWDGPLMEVEPKTIEVIKWVTRASREQGQQN